MRRDPQPAEPISLAGRPEIRRIGVFKFRNIGDVLLMTPALRALRHSFPQAKIVVAVTEGTEAMLEGNPDVDAVWVHSKKAKNVFGRLRNEINFFNNIRRERFDLTINFTRGERSSWCSLFSGARWRVSYYNWWGKWNWRNLAYNHVYRAPEPAGHEVAWHLHLLQKLGVSVPDQRLRLEVSESQREWARATLNVSGVDRFVLIHPVSRWLFKCWDDARMAEIIDWLQTEMGYRVVLTSGPQGRELERARSILSKCKTTPLTFLGTIDLSKTAALISLSEAYFGVDTAPMHMAAAIGVPVVALFGPSGSVGWSPWGDRVYVLDHGCPCGTTRLEGCNWDGVRSCMLAISVEEAKEALEKALLEKMG